MRIEVTNSNIAKALQFITQNFIKQITLGEISKECGMSKYHFTRTFKSATGITFRKYHNKTRIEASKILLKKQKLNITEISYAVGFSDASYFSRVFRGLEGISPALYKKKIADSSHAQDYLKTEKQYYPFFEQESASN